LRREPFWRPESIRSAPEMHLGLEDRHLGVPEVCLEPAESHSDGQDMCAEPRETYLSDAETRDFARGRYLLPSIGHLAEAAMGASDEKMERCVQEVCLWEPEMFSSGPEMALAGGDRISSGPRGGSRELGDVPRRTRR
jgi:hypothetical protein